jgi:hypothetical protein
MILCSILFCRCFTGPARRKALPAFFLVFSGFRSCRPAHRHIYRAIRRNGSHSAWVSLLLKLSPLLALAVFAASFFICLPHLFP